MDTKKIEALAAEIRVNLMNCVASIGSGHIGGSLSVCDLLAVLYGDKMNYDPKNPKMEGRDRLVCSKGHAGPAVYSVLAEVGFFDKAELLTLNQGGTNLPSHCDMNKTPGVDYTAGSLGQGFSAAVGLALGSKLKGDNARIYAIIGDGESEEGQIWEGAMVAAQRKLDNLTAFTDNNKLQLDGYTKDISAVEPMLAEKWRAFGWNVIEINGHNVEQISNAIDAAKCEMNRPTMIIMDTIKGKGVSYVENAGTGNHSMTITPELRDQAIAEIRGALC